jgi:hypothetical protein
VEELDNPEPDTLPVRTQKMGAFNDLVVVQVQPVEKLPTEQYP